MKKIGIILAGGRGLRAGGDRPKQFQPLCGRPVIWWSMKSFANAFPDVKLIVVLHPDCLSLWHEMWESLPADAYIPHLLAEGGKTRPESVVNGLGAVNPEDAGDDAVIMIHDGARPLITPEVIRRGVSLLERGKGVIPVVKTVNSLRKIVGPDKYLESAESKSVDRSDYVEVQTPQIFFYADIAPLYGEERDMSGFTDDASVAEASGMKIGLYEGSTENIKITHPEDFIIAEAILSSKKC